MLLESGIGPSALDPETQRFENPTSAAACQVDKTFGRELIRPGAVAVLPD